MLIVRPNSITSISESSGPNGWESRGANGRGTFSRSVFFLSSARSRIVADHRPLPFLQSQHQLRSSHPTQPSRSEEGEPSPESTSTRLQSRDESNSLTFSFFNDPDPQDAPPTFRRASCRMEVRLIRLLSQNSRHLQASSLLPPFLD